MKFHLTTLVFIFGLGSFVFGENEIADYKSHFTVIGYEILQRTEMVIQQMRIRAQPMADQIALRDKATNLSKLMSTLEASKGEFEVKCAMRNLFQAQCVLSVQLQNYLAKYPKNRIRTFGLY